MKTQSEEFRAQAAECQELANHYGDLIKQQYEQLAFQWLYLVARAEAADGRLPSVPTVLPLLLRTDPRAWLAIGGTIETRGSGRAEAALVLKPTMEGAI